MDNTKRFLISNFSFFFLNLNLINLSSVQDACHMNFIIDLAHHGVSVVEHRSTESESLRFDSSWGLRIFSLSHTYHQTKNIFL